MGARNKRCRHDVIADVLELLVKSPEGVRITELCRMANLPVDRGLKLMQELADLGLVYVVNEGKSRVFIIADSGYVYLGLYRELQRLLHSRSE